MIADYTRVSNMFRQLWFEHNLWTRSAIISIADELDDAEPVTRRLLRNPTDFAVALRPFLGSANASQFEALLRDHLVIGGELFKDHKARNPLAIANERKKWYANGEEIARFMGAVNPNWSTRQWRTMFNRHLKLVEEESITRTNKQYAANVAISDPIIIEAAIMADMMTNGLVRP